MANRRTTATPGTVDEARQVLAELHGMLKDIKAERAALAADWKKVTELRDRLRDDLEHEIVKFVEKQGAEVRNLVNGEVDQIKEIFEQGQELQRQHIAEVMAAESPADLLRTLTEGITRVLQAKLDKELVDLREWMIRQTNGVIKDAVKDLRVQVRAWPR